MPSSAVRTFIDPDTYFAGIRNLQIDGVITQRGEFRAESTRIDLHRLWMHRLDESLPRIMRVTPSGKRAADRLRDRTWQPTMLVSGDRNTGRHKSPCNGLDWPWYLRSSAPAMGLHVADARGSCRRQQGDHRAPIDAALSFARSLTPAPVASRLLRKLHEAAGHLAKTAPDILAKPEVARAIEEALLEAMILVLTEGHSDHVRNVHRHRARVMRRLEEVLEL